MIGQSVSHYKILEKLGEGGMGVVYKAEDTKLDRIVALKFLPHHLTANDAEKARFLQEAKAAAALNHPNVCAVIDIQESNGQQFIIMEYVDGSTLRKKIPIQKEEDAIRYAIQIGEALQAAHAKGIVHRDVKSENIMLSSEGRIKVMDFGLAKLKGSLKLTKTSSTVGTLSYMAPEQLRGDEADTRSDIFSFGVVLFEMLTGRFPFRGEHEAAIMYSIVNEEPESALKYVPALSQELDRIIHRTLEKDPADRYQHVDDMVSELRRLQKASTRVIRPEGIGQSKVSQSVNIPVPAPKKLKIPILIGIPSVAVIAVAAWFLFFDKPAQKITSIAVLPFVNAGADQSTEYLSDGFTESLINRLSKLPGVKMMSRNSVFRYKGKEIDPQAVGKELNVGAVLMGRIVQNADALNVSVELVNTSDNSHIWGEQYERKASNIITLQNDISHELSKQLQVTLTGDEEKQISKNATENTEAYQYYLKGRFYWNKRTAENFVKAEEMFQRAISLDPNYALAYSGLADCYNLMSSYFVLPSKEAYAKAKVAANKAIELDNTLGEPHTNLASIASEYEWNFTEGEREYKRAIELNPNYATARHWYGEYLTILGRGDEGLPEMLKAIELDPLAPVLYHSTGWVYYVLGDYQKALSYQERALELDPKLPRAFSLKMLIHLELGHNDEALKFAQDAISASGNGIEYRAWLANAYARTGNRREAEKILKDLLALSEKEYVAPVLFAFIYTGLGNKDKAFEWLETVYNNRSGDIIALRADPVWKSLRTDPRFTALTEKVGIPHVK
jgi:serine/threonine-protein kinase